MMVNTSLALAIVLTFGAVAEDDMVGEEVEVSSGSVTGLSCALEARETGDLSKLNTCPLREALGGIVVYDVVEEVIIHVDEGSVPRHALESAYGGGSIDLYGTVTAVDAANGVMTVKTEEHTVMKKPKAGGFKGCL